MNCKENGPNEWIIFAGGPMRTSRPAAVSRAKVLTQEMPQPCKPLYSSYAQEGDVPL